jgi:regulator of sirC expression with transglutaminase-like and TPR domain
VSYQISNNLERAIADFDRAISLQPQHAMAFGARGLARLQQGQEAAAQRDFEQCLSLAPHLKAALDERINAIKAAQPR